MTSFQAKIGWKRLGKRENKNYRFVPFQLDAQGKILKKIGKKFKKLKSTIMTSFQAKIGWKRQRKRENKNYNFVPSLPDAKFQIAKKLQKIKKIKKCQYGFI